MIDLSTLKPFTAVNANANAAKAEFFANNKVDHDAQKEAFIKGWIAKGDSPEVAEKKYLDSHDLTKASINTSMREALAVGQVLVFPTVAEVMTELALPFDKRQHIFTDSGVMADGTPFTAQGIFVYDNTSGEPKRFYLSSLMRSGTVAADSSKTIATKVFNMDGTENMDLCSTTFKKSTYDAMYTAIATYMTGKVLHVHSKMTEDCAFGDNVSKVTCWNFVVQ